MRLLLSLSLAALGAAALLAACGKGGEGTGGTSGQVTCDPGENIFCRCPGGEAGTKECKADGHSFEACVTRTGACPEIPDTTSSSSSSSSSSGAGGTGGTGGGAPGKLYDPCGVDGDCESGMCPYGYCTMECAKFDECTLGTGECVQFQGSQICMPLCTVNDECEGAFGAPSACGYTAAVDGTPVTTCADWKASLKLPPAGTDCVDDVDCNLGHTGVQAVCAFQACTKGCYVQADCPPNTTCSSQGTLGSCN